MNPNISVEKVVGEENRFTITQVGAGGYLMPRAGVIISYGGMDYVITNAERLGTKPPAWEVAADENGQTSLAGVETDPTRFTQLITPNPDIPCTPGLCLVYVRKAFGVGPKYSTATEGWNASTSKHQDHNFPNAWVPVWFSLADEPAGHVALRQPDGSVWSASHPTANQPIRHKSLEEMYQYFNNRLGYLGWTEDIEGKLVVSSNGS